FVDGQRLDKAWPEFTNEVRTEVASQVKDYYHQLRMIMVPDGALIGSIDGGHAIDRGGCVPEEGGPFKSAADFNQWLIKKNPSDITRLRTLRMGTH
ncbi:hypothetical protein IFR05_017369, partial [Cadophora sp. M221]